MELTLRHNCELLMGEFADREKIWTSFCNGKKIDWLVSSAFLFKLRNEGLSDLHEVLHAPVLKTDVGKHQLHFDVGLLTSEGTQKDFDCQKELAHVIGLICHTSIMAEDQLGTLKFLSDGPAVSHMSQISSALSALALSFGVQGL